MSENLAQLIEGLHPLEHKVLSVLKQSSPLWENALLDQTHLDESRLSMALGWLLTKNILTVEIGETTSFVSITELGRKYAGAGVPEKRIFNRLKAGKKFAVRDISHLEEMDSAEVSTARVGILDIR